MFFLNYVRKGFCGVECLSAHYTVFILLISITIFWNKHIAQVQFYFMHAGVAESLGKLSLLQGKKHSNHLIKVEVVLRKI